jgi:cell shape-determining protein MreD
MSLSRIPLVAGPLIIAFVIQEAFVNRINFFLGGFAFYLAFSIAWILKEDRSTAVLVGFISGLIADLSPTLEAPFGLWMLVMTGFAFVLTTYVRGSLDPNLSPLTLSVVTAAASAVALILFLIFGAILGQDVAPPNAVIREISGNTFWSFLLSPFVIPFALKMHNLSLTARER